jgi:hypothetical protein
MTCVIPAWQVLEVLEMTHQKNPVPSQEVRENDANPTAESALRSTDANSAHREDLNWLLRSAVVPPADKENKS